MSTLTERMTRLCTSKDNAQVKRTAMVLLTAELIKYAETLGKDTDVANALVVLDERLARADRRSLSTSADVR